jgi:hypothetical protein
MEWLTYGAYMVVTAYGVEKMVGLSNKFSKQKEKKCIEETPKIEVLHKPTTKYFNEMTIYEMTIYLCKRIQRREWGFFPDTKNKNGYFDQFKAGHYYNSQEAGFNMKKGEGTYHEVEIRVFNQEIMTFDFYPDGTCKNFTFSYYFLTKENASYFMSELKKTMKEFLRIHENKLTDNLESLLEQDPEWNVSSVNEEMNEKLKHINDMHAYLMSKKEELSAEQLHEMEKILHERVRPLLIHYEALSEETKQEKKEDVLQALDRAYNKLHSIQEQYEHAHKLALEKQLQLLR